MNIGVSRGNGLNYLSSRLHDEKSPQYARFVLCRYGERVEIPTHAHLYMDKIERKEDERMRRHGRTRRYTYIPSVVLERKRKRREQTYWSISPNSKIFNL